MTVRKITLADLDRICEIESSSFADPWSREDLESSLSSVLTEVYGLEAFGTLWGYMIFSLIPGCQAEIESIAVDPSKRCSGFGSAMMDFFVSRCRDNNIPEAFLEVRESNAAAKKLYIKYGFKEIGLRRGYYRDGEDAVLMKIRP